MNYARGMAAQMLESEARESKANVFCTVQLVTDVQSIAEPLKKQVLGSSVVVCFVLNLATVGTSFGVGLLLPLPCFLSSLRKRKEFHNGCVYRCGRLCLGCGESTSDV
mmetsp:Transcript_70918/g.178805  ORF Transcript_70918/g.178805 Transcript_70918/m.178805 type:complete len:108 (-) Transcript_70918:45-368(-)